MIKILLAFLFSFFLSSYSFAESLRIKLVLVPGEDALTEQEFFVFSRDLRRYLRAHISDRIRIDRSVKRITPPKDWYPDYSILNRESKQVTHYVFPPTNGYVYGWAYQCSYFPRHNGYSTAKLSLWYESLTAAAHEISHQLGAKHRPGLMHPFALDFAKTSIPLPISQTLTDIYKCGNFIKRPTDANSPAKRR